MIILDRDKVEPSSDGGKVGNRETHTGGNRGEDVKRG